MTCSDAGRLGAIKRHQLEREPILARARAMNAAMGLPDDPRLSPVLVLTRADRVTS